MAFKKKVTKKYLKDSLPVYADFLERIRIYSIVSSCIIKELENIDEPGVSEKSKYLKEFSISYDVSINFQGFLTTSILDLTVIAINIKKEKVRWENVFYLKQGCLIVYETIKTYNIYTKRVRGIGIHGNAELNIAMEEITKELRQYKKDNKYESYMADLRNFTSAHVSEDFATYCKTIKGIDAKNISASIFQFLAILKALHDLCFGIIKWQTEQLLSYTGKQLEDYKINEFDYEWISKLHESSPKMLS